MKVRRVLIIGIIVALAACIWLLLVSDPPRKAVSRNDGAREAMPPPAGAAPPIAPRGMDSTKAPAAAVAPSRPSDETPRDPIPTRPLHAQRKIWVRGTYGPSAKQFGKYKNEAHEYPPQGFVVTTDGKLLVLDTGKKRLLWYNADGELEREQPLPADTTQVPADVAVAQDGTIVVMDHLKEIVLLDPSGKQKAVMPKPKEDVLTGMYTVGNQIMATLMGVETAKAGDTSGTPDAETQALHVQEENGRIPGHVAPDGITVLSVGFDDRENGDFWVSAMKGSPGQEVFTRFFHAPGVTGIPLIQADAMGRVYLVVNTSTTLSMICLDGKTGEPVGMVDLPRTYGTGGNEFRQFNVAPNGGVMYQEAYPDSVSYEWFNCF